MLKTSNGEVSLPAVERVDPSTGFFLAFGFPAEKYFFTSRGHTDAMRRTFLFGFTSCLACSGSTSSATPPSSDASTDTNTDVGADTTPTDATGEHDAADALGDADSTVDVGPCSITGHWVGTRVQAPGCHGTDAGPIDWDAGTSTSIAFDVTQSGDTLTVDGVAGTIHGSSVSWGNCPAAGAGCRDFAGTVSPTCDAMSGTWTAFECAWGTFEVHRP